MTAAGKTTAAALAKRVAAGEPVRILVTHESAESARMFDRKPVLAAARRKTGVMTLVATSVEVRTYQTFRRSQRDYVFTTSEGVMVLAPAETVILAPEDVAAIKRAHAEALEMNAEFDRSALACNNEAPAEPESAEADPRNPAVVHYQGTDGKAACDMAAHLLDGVAHRAVSFNDGDEDASCTQCIAYAMEVTAETPAEPFATREEWLIAAVDAMRPMFAEQGAEIPAVRVSVGWPGGRGKKNAVIGQCWASAASADKVAQVFISPVLDDAGAVLATLAHELVHAVDDCKSGHKGNFARLAKGIGLAGKMTATVAGEELKPKLAEIAAGLGAYPHAKLLSFPAGKGEKTQTTRMIKCSCADCGYTARTTKKWLDEVGAPICPCNREEMQVG
ncbi:hypothetical protein AB0H43_03175 [Hamadaea sp. NPDC050747]|uniref:hypothetical protein n=1 Tax=Hamadaea sp. NPDC050747 TaxID=3155789 RepID=UPI003408D474